LSWNRRRALADVTFFQSVRLFLQLGDGGHACKLHRWALANFRRHCHVAGIAASLEWPGIEEAIGGDAPTAARLLGAASRLADGQSPPLARGNPEARDQAAAAVREKLGPEAWETAWQAGRAMAREEAIAFALDDAGT
jgi:hypothetical protein